MKKTVQFTKDFHKFLKQKVLDTDSKSIEEYLKKNLRNNIKNESNR